jgi:hypothetical protein
MYADDNQLMISYRPSEQKSVASIIQKDLDILQAWMASNNLTINAARTQIITFGSHHQLNKTAGSISSLLSIQGSLPLKQTTS